MNLVTYIRTYGRKMAEQDNVIFSWQLSSKKKSMYVRMYVCTYV